MSNNERMKFTSKFILLSLLIASLTSCLDKVKISIPNKVKEISRTAIPVAVTKIEIKNNHIVLRGSALSSVTTFTLQGNTQTFNIISKSNNELVVKPTNNLAINLNNVMNMILGTANASTIIPVHITLDIPGAQTNDFLQFNGVTWDSRSINGLSYKGTWDATSVNDPDLSPQSGDYYVVGKNGSHSLNGITSWTKGDWAVYADGVGWQKIDNSTTPMALEMLSNVSITGPSLNQVLMWNGSQWINQLFTAPPETDPKVGAVTLNKWCRGDGAHIVCDQSTPVMVESDPSVKAFAKANLPTCSATQVLKANGVSLSCVNNGGSGGTTYSGSPNLVMVTDSTGAMSESVVSTATLNYLQNVTSDIQAQLDSKSDSSTIIDWSGNGIQTIDLSRISFPTSERVIVSSPLGFVEASSVSTTELNYLSGVTSGLQTQIDSKADKILSTSTTEFSKIKIFGSNTTNHVEITAPTLAGNVSFTLPSSHGSVGQYLTTNSSGVLSWNTLQSEVQSVVLSSYVDGVNSVVLSSDSLVGSIGKLQKQISTISSSKIGDTGGTLSVGTISGIPLPVNSDDVASKEYVDTFGKWEISGSDLLRNSKVSIGSTSAPVYALDVTGDVNVTGTFRINGTAFTSGLSASSPTTGAIAKFASSSTLGNSLISDNGTTVTAAGLVDITAGTGTASSSAPLRLSTANTPRIAFNRSGTSSQIGIDASSGIRTYDAAGTGYESFSAKDITANGNATATAYYYTSDRRLKRNIRTIAGLETILPLRGVRFDWIKDGKHEIGLIAQEIEALFPELVQTNEAGLKSVKYGNLVAPLIESTKELYNKTVDIEERLTEMEKRMSEKDQLIDKQQKQIETLLQALHSGKK